jgi:hypothetical protein
MGAALLLRPNVLAAFRVEGSAVVGSVGEVDGDIDGFPRDEGTDLTAKGEREGAPGPPERQMTEEPPGGAVGMAPTALGASPVNRGTKGRRPKQEIRGIAKRGGSKGPDESAREEG